MKTSFPTLGRRAADPAATSKLSAVFDAQVKAMHYAVPPYADTPAPLAGRAEKLARDSTRPQPGILRDE